MVPIINIPKNNWHIAVSKNYGKPEEVSVRNFDY